ncbi:MAG TPA: methyl-accepting chemotaxis protein [Actinomycetes bacterium]
MKLIGSISAKVIALTALGVLVAIVVGAAGTVAVDRISGRVDRMALVQKALHNQAEVDGANYAIQYDVVAAAEAGRSAVDRKQLLDDLAERQRTIEEGTSENRALLERAGAGAQARAAFDQVAGPLDAYVAASGKAAEALATDPAAAAGQVAAVEAAQDAFDAPFDGVTEAINQFAATVQGQAHDDARRAHRFTLAALVGACLLIPTVGLVIRRTIERSTGAILEVVTTAADGDLTREVAVGGDDAIGRMGAGMARFLTNLRGSIGGIGHTAQALSASSEELLTVSDQIAATAETASAQAGVVSSAAQQVSGNVGTVAVGTREMGEAIREIARNASEAASVAARAVEVAGTANLTVAKLGSSSAEVGEVVKVIDAIAEQTNLLALNASIEAARAGAAGKGFAVVASEVKELAQATGKATADIASRIQAIQSDAGAAVTAIDEIGSIISQINDIQTMIAGAVEEQTATTSEISRSVGDAASSSQEIAGAITGVAQATAEASRGVSETRRAAEDLAGMAAELRRLVGQFTC